MHIKQFFQVAALIALAGGVQPAYSAYWQWSTSAANNATADPSINFSEGMAPSAVNDSARALMAREAENRKDTSGELLTSGTATAYTLSTNQGIQTPTPIDGQMLAMSFNVTNGVGATLQVDGGTAYPINVTSTTGVPAGGLNALAPYTLRFSTTVNAWVLRDYYPQTFGVPLGGYVDVSHGQSIGGNFVLASGQCISRTTYAAYFSAVGTIYGTCDGTTTFGVPDQRGRASFAADNQNGTAANRLTSASGCSAMTGFGSTASCGVQTYQLSTPNLPPYTPSGAVTSVFFNGSAANDQVMHTQVSGPDSGAYASLGPGCCGGPNAVVTGLVNSSFAGNAQGGTSVPVPIIPPALAVYRYVRVL